MQSEPYLLVGHCYIEVNPVRAGMVAARGEYPWSRYRSNARGDSNPIPTGHAEYVALGGSEESRRAGSRDLYANQFDPTGVKQVRECLQTGTPFGNDRLRKR